MLAKGCITTCIILWHMLKVVQHFQCIWKSINMLKWDAVKILHTVKQNFKRNLIESICIYKNTVIVLWIRGVKLILWEVCMQILWIEFELYKVGYVYKSGSYNL